MLLDDQRWWLGTYMLIWLFSSNVAYATMYLLEISILIMLLLSLCYAAKTSHINKTCLMALSLCGLERLWH